MTPTGSVAPKPNLWGIFDIFKPSPAVKLNTEELRLLTEYVTKENKVGLPDSAYTKTSELYKLAEKVFGTGNVPVDFTAQMILDKVQGKGTTAVAPVLPQSGLNPEEQRTLSDLVTKEATVGLSDSSYEKTSELYRLAEKVFGAGKVPANFTAQMVLVKFQGQAATLSAAVVQAIILSADEQRVLSELVAKESTEGLPDSAYTKTSELYKLAEKVFGVGQVPENFTAQQVLAAAPKSATLGVAPADMYAQLVSWKTGFDFSLALLAIDTVHSSAELIKLVAQFETAPAQLPKEIVFGLEKLQAYSVAAFSKYGVTTLSIALQLLQDNGNDAYNVMKEEMARVILGKLSNVPLATGELTQAIVLAKENSIAAAQVYTAPALPEKAPSITGELWVYQSNRALRLQLNQLAHASVFDAASMAEFTAEELQAATAVLFANRSALAGLREATDAQAKVLNRTAHDLIALLGKEELEKNPSLKEVIAWYTKNNNGVYPPEILAVYLTADNISALRATEQGRKLLDEYEKTFNSWQVNLDSLRSISMLDDSLLTKLLDPAQSAEALAVLKGLFAAGTKVSDGSAYVYDFRPLDMPQMRELLAKYYQGTSIQTSAGWLDDYRAKAVLPGAWILPQDFLRFVAEQAGVRDVTELIRTAGPNGLNNLSLTAAYGEFSGTVELKKRFKGLFVAAANGGPLGVLPSLIMGKDIYTDTDLAEKVDSYGGVSVLKFADKVVGLFPQFKPADTWLSALRAQKTTEAFLIGDDMTSSVFKGLATDQVVLKKMTALLVKLLTNATEPFIIKDYLQALNTEIVPVLREFKTAYEKGLLPQAQFSEYCALIQYALMGVPRTGVSTETVFALLKEFAAIIPKEKLGSFQFINFFFNGDVRATAEGWRQSWVPVLEGSAQSIAKAVSDGLSTYTKSLEAIGAKEFPLEFAQYLKQYYYVGAPMLTGLLTYSQAQEWFTRLAKDARATAPEVQAFIAKYSALFTKKPAQWSLADQVGFVSAAEQVLEKLPVGMVEGYTYPASGLRLADLIVMATEPFDYIAVEKRSPVVNDYIRMTSALFAAGQVFDPAETDLDGLAESFCRAAEQPKNEPAKLEIKAWTFFGKAAAVGKQALGIGQENGILGVPMQDPNELEPGWVATVAAPWRSYVETSFNFQVLIPIYYKLLPFEMANQLIEAMTSLDKEMRTQKLAQAGQTFVDIILWRNVFWMWLDKPLDDLAAGDGLAFLLDMYVALVFGAGTLKNTANLPRNVLKTMVQMEDMFCKIMGKEPTMALRDLVLKRQNGIAVGMSRYFLGDKQLSPEGGLRTLGKPLNAIESMHKKTIAEIQAEIRTAWQEAGERASLKGRTVATAKATVSTLSQPLLKIINEAFYWPTKAIQAIAPVRAYHDLVNMALGAEANGKLLQGVATKLARIHDYQVSVKLSDGLSINIFSPIRLAENVILPNGRTKGFIGDMVRTAWAGFIAAENKQIYLQSLGLKPAEVYAILSHTDPKLMAAEMAQSLVNNRFGFSANPSTGASIERAYDAKGAEDLMLRVADYTSVGAKALLGVAPKTAADVNEKVADILKGLDAGTLKTDAALRYETIGRLIELYSSAYAQATGGEKSLLRAQAATISGIIDNYIQGKEFIGAELVAGGGKTMVGLVQMRMLMDLMEAGLVPKQELIYVVPKGTLLTEFEDIKYKKFIELLYGKSNANVMTGEQPKFKEGKLNICSVDTLFFTYIQDPKAIPRNALLNLDELDKYFFLDSEYISTNAVRQNPLLDTISTEANYAALKSAVAAISKTITGTNSTEALYRVINEVIRLNGYVSVEEVVSKLSTEYAVIKGMDIQQRSLLQGVISSVFQARHIYGLPNSVGYESGLVASDTRPAVYIAPGGEGNKDLQMHWRENGLLGLACQDIVRDVALETKRPGLKPQKIDHVKLNATLMKVGFPHLLANVASRTIGYTGTLESSDAYIKAMLDGVSDLRGYAVDALLFKAPETFPTLTLKPDEISRLLSGEPQALIDLKKAISDRVALYGGSFDKNIIKFTINPLAEMALSPADRLSLLGDKEKGIVGILEQAAKAVGREPVYEINTGVNPGLETRTDSLRSAARAAVANAFEIKVDASGRIEIVLKGHALLAWCNLDRSMVETLKAELRAAIQEKVPGQVLSDETKISIAVGMDQAKYVAALAETDARDAFIREPQTTIGKFLAEVVVDDVAALGERQSVETIKQRGSMLGRIVILSWANRGTDFGWKKDPYIGVLGLVPKEADLVQIFKRGARFDKGASIDYFVSRQDIDEYVRNTPEDSPLRTIWNKIPVGEAAVTAFLSDPEVKKLVGDIEFNRAADMNLRTLASMQSARVTTAVGGAFEDVYRVALEQKITQLQKLWEMAEPTEYGKKTALGLIESNLRQMFTVAEWPRVEVLMRAIANAEPAKVPGLIHDLVIQYRGKPADGLVRESAEKKALQLRGVAEQLSEEASRKGIQSSYDQKRMAIEAEIMDIVLRSGNALQSFDVAEYLDRLVAGKIPAYSGVVVRDMAELERVLKVLQSGETAKGKKIPGLDAIRKYVTIQTLFTPTAEDMQKVPVEMRKQLLAVVGSQENMIQKVATPDAKVFSPNIERVGFVVGEALVDPATGRVQELNPQKQQVVWVPDEKMLMLPGSFDEATTAKLVSALNSFTDAVLAERITRSGQKISITEMGDLTLKSVLDSLRRLKIAVPEGLPESLLARKLGDCLAISSESCAERAVFTTRYAREMMRVANPGLEVLDIHSEPREMTVRLDGVIDRDIDGFGYRLRPDGSVESFGERPVDMPVRDVSVHNRAIPLVLAKSGDTIDKLADGVMAKIRAQNPQAFIGKTLDEITEIKQAIVDSIMNAPENKGIDFSKPLSADTSIVVPENVYMFKQYTELTNPERKSGVSAKDYAQQARQALTDDVSAKLKALGVDDPIIVKAIVDQMVHDAGGELVPGAKVVVPTIDGLRSIFGFLHADLSVGGAAYTANLAAWKKSMMSMERFVEQNPFRPTDKMGGFYMAIVVSVVRQLIMNPDHRVDLTTFKSDAAHGLYMGVRDEFAQWTMDILTRNTGRGMDSFRAIFGPKSFLSMIPLGVTGLLDGLERAWGTQEFMSLMTSESAYDQAALLAIQSHLLKKESLSNIGFEIGSGAIRYVTGKIPGLREAAFLRNTITTAAGVGTVMITSNMLEKFWTQPEIAKIRARAEYMKLVVNYLLAQYKQARVVELMSGGMLEELARKTVESLTVADVSEAAITNFIKQESKAPTPLGLEFYEQAKSMVYGVYPEKDRPTPEIYAVLLGQCKYEKQLTATEMDVRIVANLDTQRTAATVTKTATTAIFGAGEAYTLLSTPAALTFLGRTVVPRLGGKVAGWLAPKLLSAAGSTALGVLSGALTAVAIYDVAGEVARGIVDHFDEQNIALNELVLRDKTFSQVKDHFLTSTMSTAQSEMTMELMQVFDRLGYLEQFKGMLIEKGKLTDLRAWDDFIKAIRSGDETFFNGGVRDFFNKTSGLISEGLLGLFNIDRRSGVYVDLGIVGHSPELQLFDQLLKGMYFWLLNDLKANLAYMPSAELQATLQKTLSGITGPEGVFTDFVINRSVVGGMQYLLNKKELQASCQVRALPEKLSGQALLILTSILNNKDGVLSATGMPSAQKDMALLEQLRAYIDTTKDPLLLLLKQIYDPRNALTYGQWSELLLAVLQANPELLNADPTKCFVQGQWRIPKFLGGVSILVPEISVYTPFTQNNKGLKRLESPRVFDFRSSTRLIEYVRTRDIISTTREKFGILSKDSNIDAILAQRLEVRVEGGVVRIVYNVDEAYLGMWQGGDRDFNLLALDSGYLQDCGIATAQYTLKQQQLLLEYSAQVFTTGLKAAQGLAVDVKELGRLREKILSLPNGADLVYRLSGSVLSATGERIKDYAYPVFGYLAYVNATPVVGPAGVTYETSLDTLGRFELQALQKAFAIDASGAIGLRPEYRLLKAPAAVAARLVSTAETFHSQVMTGAALREAYPGLVDYIRMSIAPENIDTALSNSGSFEVIKYYQGGKEYLAINGQQSFVPYIGAYPIIQKTSLVFEVPTQMPMALSFFAKDYDRTQLGVRDNTSLQALIKKYTELRRDERLSPTQRKQQLSEMIYEVPYMFKGKRVSAYVVADAGGVYLIVGETYADVRKIMRGEKQSAAFYTWDEATGSFGQFRYTEAGKLLGAGATLADRAKGLTPRTLFVTAETWGQFTPTTQAPAVKTSPSISVRDRRLVE